MFGILTDTNTERRVETGKKDWEAVSIMGVQSLGFFVVAAIFWLLYFYIIDYAIMIWQNLPIGWDLMPS